MPGALRRLALLLAVSGLAAGCHKPALPSAPDKPGETAWFRDVTAEVGLDFVHDAGPTGTYALPQIVGSGAALLDFDGDGLFDLYFLTNGGPKSTSTNRLFKQLPGGRFRDVSKGSGLDIPGHNMGAAVGDVDNDGRPDVLVTQYGGLKLFRNSGNGVFTDITAKAGLESLLWGTAAAFFDYDRDGRLDLVVVNYVDYDSSRPCSNGRGQRDYCGPGVFDGSVTRLYHNLGPGPDGIVRFKDVTAASGLASVPGPGLGVVCADFDGDRWPDIFVANDGKPNRLWINRHDGTFQDEAVLRGVAYNAMGQAQAGMGVALGDVDGDGLCDLFVTHLSDETNTLWRQGPRGLFRDRTLAAGLAETVARGTGFGTTLADFDADGRLDLAVVNGRVYRGPVVNEAALGPFWSHFAERNRLWSGEADGRFHDRSAAEGSFCGPAAVARGLVCADLNNDGRLDLVVTTVAGPARLYRNVAPRRGHWLSVRAWDPDLHRDAYGAVVTVRSGTRRWVRWVNPASSYLCSNDPRAHFGLGTADHIDAITIDWPGGSRREEYRELTPGRPVPLDRALTAVRGRGIRERSTVPGSAIP